jgi:hypothetical protein
MYINDTMAKARTVPNGMDFSGFLASSPATAIPSKPI